MLTGIQEVTQDELKNMMRFYIRMGGNLLTFGPAGIGKTEMAMQAAAEESYECMYINLSVLEAPDLIGLPVIDESGPIKRASYALPEMLPQAGTRQKKVVLLVDEIDKAKEELQNPCLELFQFRSINGTKLDIHAVIATGNLPDEGAFSKPVSHALTNRCSVYRVTHAFDPWQEWAVNNGTNPLIVAFLSRHTELLLQPPPSGDDTAYCHPSPRAWTYAAKDLNGAMDHSLDFQTMLIAGRVGQTAAVKFRVWLDHYRHIESLIDRLVKEGKSPDLSGEFTIDRQFVCAVAGVDAIMQKCRDTSKKDDRIKYIHKVTDNVMKWVGTLPSEICVGAIKSTLSMQAIKDNDLIKVKSFMDVFMKIRKSIDS